MKKPMNIVSASYEVTNYLVDGQLLRLAIVLELKFKCMLERMLLSADLSGTSSR